MAKKKKIEVSIGEIADYLKMTGQFRGALSQVISRKVTAEAARKTRIRITTKTLQQAADVFRIVHGLRSAAGTKKWLKSEGLSVEAFEAYLETNLLISAFKDELEKKTGKKPYLSSPQIKATVKEMIYQQWLENELK